MSEQSMRPLRECLGRVALGDAVWWATTSKPRQDAPSTVTGVSRDDDSWRVKIRGPGGGRYWLVVEGETARMFHGKPPEESGTSAGALTEFGRLVELCVED